MSDETVPSTGSPMIEFRDVCKRFGRKEVLRGVSLAVYSGETVVVLGGSGTGKSVMLKHVVGLLRPDRGSVLVEEEPVAELDEDRLVGVRRKVAFLFQAGALFDSMNVFDNIAFPLREAGWDEPRIAARVPETLALVDLRPEAATLLPASLSGGMRKRVALARAIAVAPRAILYDEPTTGLDPVTANTINHLIRSMQQKLRVTSIVVTHDIASAFYVADRIAFLHDGVIRFVGRAEEARRGADPLLAAFLEGRALEGTTDA
jgi:phospholipid/cholesterol/gamma-HCH transport system ATP-binding protein